MYFIASFQYSLHLELAISCLEQNGIGRDRILAVPLEIKTEKRRLFDTIYKSDGISLFDGAAILGTIFMLLGVILGYRLFWGPIIWGLIGAISGIILGFLLDIIPKKGHRSKNKIGNKASEVILIINCDKDKQDIVRELLWEYLASGIGTLHQPGTDSELP